MCTPMATVPCSRKLNLHQCDAQPAYSSEEKTLAKKADETCDEMDCHLCHSDLPVSPISGKGSVS